MAGVVEKFVTTVREQSDQGGFAQLWDYIGKNIDALIKAPIHHLDNALETLNYQQHTLGALALLSAKYHHADHGEFGLLFMQTDKIVRHGNGEQLRIAPDVFSDMMRRLTELLVQKRQANRGIQILLRAVEKARLMPSQLTSIHCELCHLCLSAKNFQPAIAILDTDITDINKEANHFDVKHFLLYYYYGGLIYTAMKNYSRAVFFFETVVTVPASALSYIMTEAYKKLILVTLISRGVEPPQSKYASPVVTRCIKPMAMSYYKLAEAFATSSPEQLNTVAEEHRETFVQDSNYGLVKQCIQSLYKKNILRLTKTFLTLSLSDVAQRAKLSSSKEAEKYIFHMIEDGEIFATINQRDGMVQFHDNPEQFDNPEMLGVLQKQEALCVALNKKLAEMDRDITMNADYVRKTFGHGEEDNGTNSTPKPNSSYMV